METLTGLTSFSVNLTSFGVKTTRFTGPISYLPVPVPRKLTRFTTVFTLFYDPLTLLFRGHSAVSGAKTWFISKTSQNCQQPAINVY